MDIYWETLYYYKDIYLHLPALSCCQYLCLMTLPGTGVSALTIYTVRTSRQREEHGTTRLHDWGLPDGDK